MTGGSLGPYERKPLLSCFAFTSQAPDQPVGTVHFPIDTFADNDEVSQGRIKRYMDAVSASELCKERYKRIISGVQRRPLDKGPDIHSWVSLKQEAGGKQSNGFDVSPGLFVMANKKTWCTLS
ncbi:hypothetical protein F4677DRAFT_421910 [Hypoxylon crocopeplum]|nr:hypothetical protein F4677DRAFT_421910 [Hypoxylon crocopeplum]